jgi:hypothetical protein
VWRTFYLGNDRGLAIGKNRRERREKKRKTTKERKEKKE